MLDRPNRAYFVGVKGEPRFDCIVSARTLGKAVARCHKLSDDAGYRFPFPAFAKRRVPEYDAWASQFTGVKVGTKCDVDRWMAEHADRRSNQDRRTGAEAPAGKAIRARAAGDRRRNPRGWVRA